MHLKHTSLLLLILLSCIFNATYADDWDEYDYTNLSLEQQKAASEYSSEQDSQTEGAPSDETGRPDVLKSKFFQEQERLRFYTMLAICLVAIFTLSIALLFLTRMAYTSRDVINVTGLILIIFATVMVVTIADVEEQLTASIGILGAVAGYLFGSMNVSRAT